MDAAIASFDFLYFFDSQYIVFFLDLYINKLYEGSQDGGK